MKKYRFILSEYKCTKAYLILFFISFKLLQAVIAKECDFDTILINHDSKGITVRFAVDKDTNIYVNGINDKREGFIKKYTNKGEMIKKNKFTKGGHCLGIVEDRLYMFDGQYNYT